MAPPCVGHPEPSLGKRGVICRARAIPFRSICAYTEKVKPLSDAQWGNLGSMHADLLLSQSRFQTCRGTAFVHAGERKEERVGRDRMRRSGDLGTREAYDFWGVSGFRVQRHQVVYIYLLTLGAPINSRRVLDESILWGFLLI